MGKFKIWVAKKFFNDMFVPSIRTNISGKEFSDASTATKRESASDIIKKIGLRFGDLANTKDYEDPEYELTAIKEGCDVDGYLRQGVDKYVDQIFKEGYEFYGKDEGAVEYIKLRLEYMAEATDTPLGIFLIEIAEDVVKYANCIMAKSRSDDQNAFPPGMTLTGLNEKDPVAGYFLINPTTTKVKRDKNGTIKGWQQEIDDTTIKLNPEDVVHIPYKRERGNAYGTPFLLSVLNDVRALREAEDNVLKMMHRNIYPFLHIKVGDDTKPGSKTEVDETKDTIESMDIEGGLVTSNRVSVGAVDTNKVINAEPYLRYMEDRIFSGMGIPAIMFGRGNTANRSTGDNQANEMSDRIKAIQAVIETNINFKIIKELLLEGGYDPIVNPDHVVEFRFVDNDVDATIKAENHAIFKFEHNSITEDEMRALLKLEPITDRSKMHQTLITQANEAFSASLNSESKGSSSSTQKENGTKETNNKNKPTNQSGTKTSPKKLTNSVNTDDPNYIQLEDTIKEFEELLIKDAVKKEFNSIKDSICKYSEILNSIDYCKNVDSEFIKEECLKVAMYISDEINEGCSASELTNLVEIFIDNLYNNIKLKKED